VCQNHSRLPGSSNLPGVPDARGYVSVLNTDIQKRCSDFRVKQAGQEKDAHIVKESSLGE